MKTKASYKDLAHYDYIKNFSAFEVACLVAGYDPIDFKGVECEALPSSVRVGLEGVRQSYMNTMGGWRWLVETELFTGPAGLEVIRGEIDFTAPWLAFKRRKGSPKIPCLWLEQSWLAYKRLVKASLQPATLDTLQAVDRALQDPDVYLKAKFSRSAIERWLNETGPTQACYFVVLSNSKQAVSREWDWVQGAQPNPNEGDCIDRDLAKALIQWHKEGREKPTASKIAPSLECFTGAVAGGFKYRDADNHSTVKEFTFNALNRRIKKLID